jgi:hypothetical protein
MLSLVKSQQFQKEYNDFKQKIDNIKNESVKKEAIGLLRQLVAEVKAIDRQHEEMISSMKLSNTVNDHKSNLLDIRKKISSLL